VILDTDVLIALGRVRSRERISKRLARAEGPFYTTAISWGELRYGIIRLPREEREVLERRYERDVAPLVQVLDFTQGCAETYAGLRVTLERRGERLDDPDLMIASIALRHDLALVTGNTRHFSRIPGLRVENWLTED
jgi:predicted nucleic acid-binding protein